MPITAVVLAAGRGDRLRPLTDEVPKPAVPVLDVPLGAFALASLRDAGLEAVVNVSHLGPEVERALRPHAGPGVDFFIEPEEPFGTAGTLRELRDRLGDVIVTYNADVVSDVEVNALLDAHGSGGLPATVAVTEVSSGADFAISSGRATGFLDRREQGSMRGARFIGVAAFDAEVLDLIPPHGARGLGEHVLGPLARAGRLGVLVHSGYGMDAGTPRRYLRASLDVLAGRLAGPRPPGRILAADGGRAYLGPEASAAPGSLGDGAVVLAGATVEQDARVENAIVWRGEHVPGGMHLDNDIFFRGARLRRL
jgi:mannose-1-phosphate guanylyltransferase